MQNTLHKIYKGAIMFKKKRAPKVKVVRIGHGILGRTDNRRIENAISKWLQKGYKLQEQKVVDSRNFFSRGYTLLTFIETVD